MPDVSVIIPFRLEPNLGPDAVSSRVAQSLYQTSYFESSFPGSELIWADSEEHSIFNRAASRNKGTKEATGEVFVFVDVDSTCPAEQLSYLITEVMGHNKYGLATWGFPYKRYLNLSEAATRQYFKDVVEGRRDLIFHEGDCEYIFPSQSHPEPSVGGIVVVSRQAFEHVGGYDDRFSGWGEEDRAFAMALETLVGYPLEIDGDLVHFWHPAPEDVRFGQPDFQFNRALCNRYREAQGQPGQMRQVLNID